MASGLMSESRNVPKAGRKNFSAFMFAPWVFSARNGGFERFSRNQSAHVSKVRFLLASATASFPSSRASRRSRRKRSAFSRSVIPVDSFRIPSWSRYRTHQKAEPARWYTVPWLFRGLPLLLFIGFLHPL